MRIYFHYILFIIAIGLASCATDLEVDFDGFEDHLVINSFLTDSSSFTLHITKSGNILDENLNIRNVDDAQVFIKNTTDNTVIELFHVRDGYYETTGAIPESGVEYELNVSVIGYDEIRALDRIPSAPVIQKVDSDSILLNNRKGVEVNFTITELQDSDNYYLWDFVDKDEDIIGLLQDLTQPLEVIKDAFYTTIEENNVSSVDEGFNDIGLNQFLLGSDDFRNSVYDATFISYDEDKPREDTDIDISDPQKPEDTVGVNGPAKSSKKLRVIALSKNMYDYINSAREYKRGQNANSIQSSPAELHSNINGGYGIFGAYSLLEIEI